MQAFASRLGVRYEFVETQAYGRPRRPHRAPGVGQGSRARASHPDPDPGRRPGHGSHGAAVTKRSVEFSHPTFPTQVWVVAPRGSPVKPIVPSGDVERDIAAVKRLLAGKRVLGVPNTCLDHSLYGVEAAGGRPVRLRTTVLDEVAPALLRGEGELALIDVADVDLAFERWPGRFTVVGPVSPVQDMAAAFRKDAPELRKAFDAFLVEARKDGSYDRLLARYFPRAGSYFPGHFERER